MREALPLAPVASGGDASETPRARAALSRLALSLDEAAATLGVSRDFFDEHIRPELRIVRRGRRPLVAIRELERWLAESASVPVGDECERS